MNKCKGCNSEKDLLGGEIILFAISPTKDGAKKTYWCSWGCKLKFETKEKK